MAKRPTIIDVAKQAGVSKSTVSLVLQNSASVKEETRVAVKEAMAEIGYVYNRSAANMRTQNAGLIGLVINDLRNPFFTEFATSLQMALADAGYSTVVANTDEDPKMQAQVIGAMIEHGVAALIVCPTYGQSHLAFDAIEKAGIPAMQLLRQVDPRLHLFPFVAPDYKAGSQLATQHLLDQGARSIAFVGGLNGKAVTQERMAGYLEVLERNDLDPLVLTGESSRMFGMDSAKLLAKENPQVDAALCFNDLVALGMLHGCNEIGRKVGREFKIVGFDDIEEVSYTFPALTSVQCDIVGIGEQTASSIVNWLEKDVRLKEETRTEVKLATRDSSRS